MGLAASQVRFLQLTGRKSDITRELQHLSLEKMALTRDMQAVSREYQAALSTKTMKWSNNSGITYSDLSYSTLMRPSALNGNKPVLVSDAAGRVVIDKNYEEYAKMISENGAAGGDYQSNRSEILAALTGLDAETIDTANATSQDVKDKAAAVKEAKETRDSYLKTYTQEQFISKFLKIGSGCEIRYDEECKNTDEWGPKIKEAISGKVSADDYARFCAKCDENIQDIQNTGTKTPVDQFIAGIVTSTFGDSITAMVDKSGNSTLSEYEAADAVYQQALQDYNDAVGADAQVLVASDERDIAFYDQLFEAIAEMGWNCDEGVSDGDYLCQMLINNNYYITTMTANNAYDDTLDEDARNCKYYFDTDAATSYENIFMVNDSDASKEALAKYEYQKSLISSKESRIDTRMQDLETEQSAIVKMMESINQVKEDNIEARFSIFT